jgi:hypothetical protein
MAIWNTYLTVIWYILRQFGMFYGNLVYFMAIWYILWQFGNFCGDLVFSPRFGLFYKSNENER